PRLAHPLRHLGDAGAALAAGRRGVGPAAAGPAHLPRPLPRRGGAAGGGGRGAGPLLLPRGPRPGERSAASARVPLRLAGPGAVPIRPDEPGAGAPRRVLMLWAVALLSLSASAGERFDHQGSLFAVASGGGAFAISSSAVAVPVNGARWAGLA